MRKIPLPTADPPNAQRTARVPSPEEPGETETFAATGISWEARPLVRRVTPTMTAKPLSPDRVLNQFVPAHREAGACAPEYSIECRPFQH